MIIGSATSAGRCIEACAFWSACIAVQPLNSDWVERQTRNARVDCMRVPTKLQRSLTAFECSRFLIRSNLWRIIATMIAFSHPPYHPIGYRDHGHSWTQLLTGNSYSKASYSLNLQTAVYAYILHTVDSDTALFVPQPRNKEGWKTFRCVFDLWISRTIEQH